MPKKSAKTEAPQQNNVNVTSTPEARIPKLATNVMFSRRPGGYIEMAFISVDNQQQGVLINKILVDQVHAGQIAAHLRNQVLAGAQQQPADEAPAKGKKK